MTEGQRAYEAKRAAKAGHEPGQVAGAEGEGSRGRAGRGGQGRPSAAAPAKKPGFFGRLLEKAQKPL